MKDLVQRPQGQQRKIHSKNEFELCYIRHKYLRKVNYNPSKEDMVPYLKIVEYAARNTFHTYRYLFSTIGMEVEDIVNINRIHLVNFIGLFEMNEQKNREKYEEFCVSFSNKNNKSPNDEEVLSKNRANLTMFLKQRMEDLVRICKQKAKNIKGIRVDEYIPFYGPNPPPEDIYKLLEDNESYGFKRIDNVAFKAVKKKVKSDLKKPFQFAGSWYVAVPLEQRSLTALDFAGAGLDPRESAHNLNPEQLFSRQEEQIKFDKKKKLFKTYSKEKKTKIILGFIQKNENNPIFKEEINIARRVLRNMGYGI